MPFGHMSPKREELRSCSFHMIFQRKSCAMEATLTAACAYFAIVFVAGFALGTIRVFVLAPILGELGAVLLELPIMLAISWFACRAVIRRFAVPAGWDHRASMGAMAFVLLMLAELGLSLFAFGRPAGAFLVSLTSPSGAIGLSGQIAFGLFPLLQPPVTPPYHRP
jgi:hypothetical protein